MISQHETLCNPHPQRRHDGDRVEQEQRVQETAPPHRSDSRILSGIRIKNKFGREYNQQAISRERGLWVELAAGLLAEIRDKAQHCGPLCHAHRPRLLFCWAERVSLTGVVFALFNGTPYACRRTLHLLCAMKESTALHRRSGLGKQTSPRILDRCTACISSIFFRHSTTAVYGDSKR